ncbi:hypothetical protein F2P56_035487 [Juglans regia]|uniref:Uncharacterized protein LOC108993454 n=2 Tax=Juglans regia TaxID=51240 RepID=A0A2I4EX04_JUGRE|nr:uncharacterized protein LOC108993454 [Juglans regia]KAF5442875.1 hypothetical protein F2P56_035487 [Juglans regia]
MTVRQYAPKFVELLRFALHLVHTELLKAEKFERGLNPRIMDSLLALKIRKFAYFEDRAVILEAKLRVRAREFNQRKRQFQALDQNKGKRPMYNNVPKPLQMIKSPQRGIVASHPACQTCGKPHAQKCLMGTNTCFKCGKASHLVQECPILVAPNAQVRNPGRKNLVPARVFALTMDDADASPNLVTGILPLFSHRALVLFNSGATHSFISRKYTCLSEKAPKPSESVMSVTSPHGKSVNCHCVKGLHDRGTSVERFKKEVVFRPTGESELCFCVVGKSPMPKVISAIKATTMLRKGCAEFLASLVMPQPNEPKLQNIEVVKDFPNVFLNELPGLPQEREIEFFIDLDPKTATIPKAPYRMAPVELKELKDPLQELLDKGFIRPSVSPWAHQFSL